MIFRTMRPCAVVFAVGLAGCAGVPLETAQIEKRRTEPARDYPGCIAAIAANADYEALWAKLQLDAGEPYPPAYLSDRTYPAPAEIVTLKALRADMRDCRALESAAAEPAARKAISDAHASEDKLWTEAELGQLGWGRLNARRKANADRKAAAVKRAVVAAAQARPRAEAGRPPQPGTGAATLNLDLTASGDGSRWTERPVYAPKNNDTMRGTIKSDSIQDTAYCARFMNTPRCNSVR